MISPSPIEHHIEIARAIGSRTRPLDQGIHRGVLRRTWPLLTFALMVDALAQGAGFAIGAGDCAERASRFDLDRHPHLSAADRARFAD